MKLFSWANGILCVILLFTSHCTTPYAPPALKGNNQFLVVDGIIKNGQDSTIITLSRSANLGDSAGPQPELDASVSIVGESSGIFSLINLGNGHYAAGQLNLDITQNYQLKITASNGEQYESDFVPVRQSPPIDSLHWQRDSIGVVIYVNTHDPQNNTRYYQWEFTQTWVNEAYFNSTIVLLPDGSYADRPEDQQIYQCWVTANSTNILIASTAGLSQDIVYENPINPIPNGSVLINVEYSILVRQYAITDSAFQYWQNLKQNTELTGSIFQPQPSSYPGNIHCLNNPKEPVFGYASASSVDTARIFISNGQLPYWNYVSPSYGCTFWVPKIDSLPYYYNFPNIFQPFLFCNPLCSIALTFLSCDDCLYYGGTNIKPSYWPN
jgi:hypothetical protein